MVLSANHMGIFRVLVEGGVLNRKGICGVIFQRVCTKRMASWGHVPRLWGHAPPQKYLKFPTLRVNLRLFSPKIIKFSLNA